MRRFYGLVFSGLWVIVIAGLAVASEITVKDKETGKTYVITLPDVVEGTVEESAVEPPPPPTDGIPEPDSHGNIVLRKKGTYDLTKDLTNRVYIANADIELRLNGHSVITDGTPAVAIYVGYLHGNIYGTTPGANRFTLTGPGHVESLTHDAFSSEWGAAHVVKGVAFVCHAEDTGCIRTSSSFTATDCLCISHVKSTANRHQMPSVIASSFAACTVERCTVIGGQVGILARKNSVIKDNFISGDGIATNGYGVAIYRTDGVTVEGNLILPDNGRGVLINAGTDNKETDRGCIIRHNVIFARERPNSEFGGRLNANCIRVRYGARRNQVTGNYCLGVGGSPWTGGSSLYLSTSQNQPSSTYERNTFQAILDGNFKLGDWYGKAITLEGNGDWKEGVPQFNNDLINDNLIRSNHIGLSCSGPDGWTHGAHHTHPLERNRFVIEDGQTILNEFVEMARQRFDSLGIDYPEARERLDSIIASFADYQDIGIRPASYDAWTDYRWRTPVTLTIKGSGLEVDEILSDGLFIRRSEWTGPPSYPVRITVER